MSYLDGEAIGLPRAAKLLPLVDIALGHIDQWVTPNLTNFQTSTYVRPFMAGLTAEALIQYHGVTGDRRVYPALKRLADWLWTNTWVAAELSFKYTSIPRPSGGTEVAPDLNLLVAPLFAWLYGLNGDPLYIQRGDLIFKGGVAGAGTANNPSGASLHREKHFNQNYRWSFKYLEWRDRGTGAQPILRLDMGEGTGTRANDSSPTANHGTILGGATWVSGGGVRLDGVNDYIDVPAHASLELRSSLAISAWLYPRGYPAAGTYAPVVQKIDNLDARGSYRLDLDSSGRVSFGIGGSDALAMTTSAVPLNRWTHVAASFDDVSNTVWFYVNGYAVSSGTYSGTVPATTGGMRIGESRWSYWSAFLKADVKKVRVYNRHVSEGEIQTVIINEGAPPALRLELDDGTGLVAKDVSPNRNNGSLVNGPVWRSGGAGLSFDGVDDYVQVPDHASLDLQSSLSLTAWVYIRRYPVTGTFVPFAIKQNSAAAQGAYRLDIDSAGRIGFGAATATVRSSAMPLNQWVHVVGAYDRPGGMMRLYTLRGSISELKTLANTAAPAVTADPFTIAKGTSASYAPQFLGYAKDVRVYNRSLGDFEVNSVRSGR
jgi:hypothetical protein